MFIDTRIASHVPYPHMNRAYDGVLFIGDPHVSSKKIGRRKDDQLTSVLNKLDTCAEYCREFNLLPVFLGDLLDRSRDYGFVMLTRLYSTLERFPVTPITLDGNHDKTETVLTEVDTLHFLQKTGVIYVADRPGLLGTFNIGGEQVRLYVTPHGNPIPTSVPDGEGRAIMVTHHDMAFETNYPGAHPIEEIAGVAMVVNGHMHRTMPSVPAGQTLWHNPGNIEPLDITLAQQDHKAWMWAGPSSFDLHGMALPHGEDLFDMTGYLVEAGNASEAVAELELESEFAQLISAEADGQKDAQKSDDASILAGDLQRTFDTGSYSEETQRLLNLLMRGVQEKALAA